MKHKTYDYEIEQGLFELTTPLEDVRNVVWTLHEIEGRAFAKDWMLCHLARFN